MANGHNADNSDWYCIEGKTLILHIKAVPGASKTEPAGVKDGRLRFRVAAAPEDGKANSELIAALSKMLSCPRRDITIRSGERSRQKTLVVPVSETALAVLGGITV